MIAHLLTQIRSDPLIPEYRSALLLGFGVFFVLYTLYRLYFCVPIQITHTPRTTAIESVDSVSGKIQKVEYADLLKERCPQLTDPKQSVFKPTPWLLNGDAQTIWTVVHTFNNHMRVKYERELVYFKDGGHVALDWCPGPSTSRDRSTPTIVILHGLTGGSHESYIQDLVEMLVAPEHRTDRSTLPDGWPGMGYRVVVMNARGCANSRLTSPRLFNGANTEDVGAVVEYVRRRIPDAPLLGIGYSLGANIITKYVGEMKDDCPFVACVGVGSPYDLYVGNLALHRTWFGRTVYSTRIGQNLVNLFKTHIDQMATRPELDVAAIIGSKTVTEFDANATAKAFGFRHVNEYYRNGCSSAVIPDIAIPTLFLSSHDDPIASSDAIPYHETMANPNVVLAVTRMGGHLGWFQGWFSPRRWYQRPVAEFIQCMIEVCLHQQKSKEKKRSLIAFPFAEPCTGSKHEEKTRDLERGCRRSWGAAETLFRTDRCRGRKAEA
ncbi:Alpha/Beta hydrolase protein [Cladochytrium replicatum]|nr:Alpha/Beta hydrolase protein [Cladochytrium replicatum]